MKVPRFKRCIFLSSLFFRASEGRVSQLHQGAPATKRRNAVCVRNKRFQPLLPNLQGRGARPLSNSSAVSNYVSPHRCCVRGAVPKAVYLARERQLLSDHDNIQIFLARKHCILLSEGQTVVCFFPTRVQHGVKRSSPFRLLFCRG